MMTNAHDIDTAWVTVNGQQCRVWRSGRGPRVGYLPGLGGLPKWSPFAAALAHDFEVVAPSIPGFPGAQGHDQLDTHFDWLLATHDLLQAAGLTGCPLIASSVSGALAADVAAVWPGTISKLVLIAPFGLFDPAEPVTDVWAQRPGHLNGLMCTDAGVYKEFIAQPADADPLEWKVEQMRALEAAARFLFPTGNTGLVNRLGRIKVPTLLLWGEQDRVMPFSYAARFAAGLGGTSRVARLPNAGHLAELDEPRAVAQEARAFLS